MAVDQELHHLLYAAIEKKRLIRFKYKGNERVAEPHDYGIQNGVVRLLCWQIGGKSGGRIPGWRLFNVENMEGCEMLAHVFEGNREVPSGQHHRWDEVFIRVAPPKLK
jgi:WYL domain